MPTPLPADAAAALLAAQGLTTTPEGANAYAGFASLQIANSAKAFARLAFEDEPAGYTAALRAGSR